MLCAELTMTRLVKEWQYPNLKHPTYMHFLPCSELVATRRKALCSDKVICVLRIFMTLQVVTYSTKERFKQNRKKTFKGHTVAGYACEVGFSPDGKYVLSGDGEGRLIFWDWKTCKIFRSIKAHEGSVCIGAAWNPVESSKVATCGWDGTIKYWD